MELVLLYLVCILGILLVLSSIFIFEFIIKAKLHCNNNSNSNSKTQIQKIYIPTPTPTPLVSIPNTMSSCNRNIPYHNSDIRIHPHARPSYNVMMNGGYQQLGSLSAFGNKNTPIILPLFGSKLNRHRWEYYTATDKNHLIRINLKYKNRNCDDDFGCDEIENGDEVYVPTYSRMFIANMYRYNPIIYNDIIN